MIMWWVVRKICELIKSQNVISPGGLFLSHTLVFPWFIKQVGPHVMDLGIHLTQDLLVLYKFYREIKRLHL
jgi:hypothetical protein